MQQARAALRWIGTPPTARCQRPLGDRTARDILVWHTTAARGWWKRVARSSTLCRVAASRRASMRILARRSGASDPVMSSLAFLQSRPLSWISMTTVAIVLNPSLIIFASWSMVMCVFAIYI